MLLARVPSPVGCRALHRPVRMLRQGMRCLSTSSTVGRGSDIRHRPTRICGHTSIDSCCGGAYAGVEHCFDIDTPRKEHIERLIFARFRRASVPAVRRRAGAARERRSARTAQARPHAGQLPPQALRQRSAPRAHSRKGRRRANRIDHRTPTRRHGGTRYDAWTYPVGSGIDRREDATRVTEGTARDRLRRRGRRGRCRGRPGCPRGRRCDRRPRA